MPTMRLLLAVPMVVAGLTASGLAQTPDRTYSAGATEVAQAMPDQLVEPVDPPPHVLLLEGVAYLERAEERLELDGAEPLVDGDRLDTASGRAEIRWPDGTVALADADTVVDLVDPARLRLVRGTLRIRIAAGAHLAVETVPGLVTFSNPGDYLVALDAAATSILRATTIRGLARVENAVGETRISAGEQVELAEQGRPEAAPFSGWSGEFAGWAGARLADETRERASGGYLPGELAGYADEFDQHGSWAEESGYGMVWYPTVVAGWEPYTQGRWRDVGRYGTTWVGRDRWSWPTHHYGRWGYGQHNRWFWIPGRQFAPAWVSWAVGPGYVGWSPLGWNDQPVFSFSGGHGSSTPAWGGWTVVGTDAFVGGHRADRSRVDARQIDSHVLGAFVTQRVPPRFGSTVGAGGRRARPGYGAPGYGAPGYVAPGPYGPGGPPPPPENPYDKAQQHMKPGGERREAPAPKAKAGQRDAEKGAETDGRVKRVPPVPRTETPRTETPRTETPPRKAVPRTQPAKPDPGRR